ncbi:Anti-sigma factor NepR domain-containing protein [Methylorubrum populi]
MRQYQMRHPDPSAATQDPRLLGVGQGLEEAYDDLLRENPPEEWRRLAERIDAVGTTGD